MINTGYVRKKNVYIDDDKKNELTVSEEESLIFKLPKKKASSQKLKNKVFQFF